MSISFIKDSLLEYLNKGSITVGDSKITDILHRDNKLVIKVESEEENYQLENGYNLKDVINFLNISKNKGNLSDDFFMNKEENVLDLYRILHRNDLSVLSWTKEIVLTDVKLIFKTVNKSKVGKHTSYLVIAVIKKDSFYFVSIPDIPSYFKPDREIIPFILRSIYLSYIRSEYPDLLKDEIKIEDGRVHPSSLTKYQLDKLPLDMEMSYEWKYDLNPVDVYIYLEHVFHECRHVSFNAGYIKIRDRFTIYVKNNEITIDPSLYFRELKIKFNVKENQSISSSFTELFNNIKHRAFLYLR